eukprot:CAMPEP_0181319318 /NCGR_PEP_ID=MMETSP1101-20121128/17502_1 /TAXON_ID=46948 /ORGANISM="Rhodomonas abbreviata, Strain Caron Lab Isolate" /LENGTH=541 /DNA_ID=CAMNT_0023426899 /DNA_START=160 /DNA_END=1782 /DNA_ORIENTATION=-
MISALSWMPRGKAKAVPNKYEPTPEEMEEMRAAAEELGAQNADDEDEWEDMSEDEDEAAAAVAATAAKRASKAAKAAKNLTGKEKPDELAEYNLDDYDEEPGGAEGVLAGTGLSVFRSNDEDPYITLPDADDDSENDEDTIIRPTDALILACHSEESGHTLDVYVYDEAEASLFVHHDLMLNAFPLCVTWMDTARKDGQPGSFAAIGTMDTEIEVWDLDCVDSMVPAAVLGGEDHEAGEEEKGKGKKKKKKKPTKVLKEGSHKDAVLGLSWHTLQRHVLASASADKTVKIWDVPQEKCLHTLTHHSDKVQALQWHPAEAAVLLSGSFDRTVAVVDVRATAADWRAAKTTLPNDIENVLWDPHNPHHFLVSTDAGTVTCHDARQQGAGPLLTIGAHSEACTGMAMSGLVPGLLATASLDKTVKLWDLRNGKAEYVASRGMENGQVFCCSFCNESESAYTLAVGGKDAMVVIWDVASSAAVRQRWQTGRSDEEFAVEDIAMDKMSISRPDGGRDSDDSATDEEEEAPKPAAPTGKKKKKSGGK